MRRRDGLGTLEFEKYLVVNDDVGSDVTAELIVVENIESLLVREENTESGELDNESVMVAMLWETAAEGAVNGEGSTYDVKGKLLVENRRSMPSWHRGTSHVV
jgi:hypothetical protein